MLRPVNAVRLAAGTRSWTALRRMSVQRSLAPAEVSVERYTSSAKLQLQLQLQHDQESPPSPSSVGWRAIGNRAILDRVRLLSDGSSCC
ncbi:MAG: hypothetical protein M1826_000165 [Phylliscum demangeonii]|nr:MAG: hypothetical protein M1826_000165 [Phylliscum demangeonii]